MTLNQANLINAKSAFQYYTVNVDVSAMNDEQFALAA